MNKGYDFSILPQELKYSKEETEDVLDHLQNKNQRLYVFTGLVYTYAESKEALDTQVLRIISTARQNSIELDTYDYRQRPGLNSLRPEQAQPQPRGLQPQEAHLADGLRLRQDRLR